MSDLAGSPFAGSITFADYLDSGDSDSDENDIVMGITYPDDPNAIHMSPTVVKS
jgi:hypothetical protein